MEGDGEDSSGTEMTQREFNLLPWLLTRAEVVACGVPEKCINDLKFEVTAAAPAAPEGRIGWVVVNRNQKNKNGGGKQGKYRKADVAKLIGLRVE